MAKTLQYWGSGNFQEHPYTGRIVTWTEKEKQTVDDAIATKLLASGAGFVLDNDETGEVVTSRIDPVTGGIEHLLALGPKKALQKMPGRMCFFGDSLTAGGNLGAFTSAAKGKSWYSQCALTTTNLGGGTWVVAAYQGVGSAAAGSVRTDGNGSLQWNYNNEGYGPLVNVSSGGFYVLQPGGATTVECLVIVRGGTAFPTSAGEGALTSAGILTSIQQESYGYRWFINTADRFTSVETWAVVGSVAADVYGYIQQAILEPGTIAASVMLCGTNDTPATASAALTLVEQIKTNIKALAANSGVVYVGAIPPNTSVSAAARLFYQRVNEQIYKYCKQFGNVRFWNPWPYLSSPDAVATALRTGAYHTDNLHFKPFGAYLCAKPLNNMLLLDFASEDDSNMAGVWDSTMLSGPWNANPALRGTGGTVTGGHGITGSAPDNWTLSRSASTQLLTTSFTAADDEKLSWFTMAYSNGDGSDYHKLTQSVTVPSGISVGDEFVIEAEICVFAQTGNGLSTLTVQTSSGQIVYALAQFTSSRGIATLGAENPKTVVTSAPQKLRTGTTSLTLELRVGGATGATGSVGFRRFRILKV